MLLNKININHLSSLPKFTSNPIYHNYPIKDSLEINGVSKERNNDSTAKAAERIENNFINQTYAPDEKSISSIVNKVALNTNTDKKEVQEALMKLVQFSSYSQMNALTLALYENGITGIRSIDDICFDNEKDFSLGSVLNYLSKCKEQFNFASVYPSKKALFLDNLLLDKLEDIKNTQYGKDFINTIKQEIQNGETTLAAFDGWNAKVDGVDISHGLFGSCTSLEKSLELLLLKSHQENKSFDEVLNNDTIKRAQDIFGSDANVEIIRNSNIYNGSSIENITKIMKPNMPDKKSIRATIEAIVEQALPKENHSEKEIKEAQNVLAKYFNEMLVCYSAETLTNKLIEKYSDIEDFAKSQGKTMDDVYYIIPEDKKSFDLVTYQYMKVNNIDSSKVLHYNGNTDYSSELDEYDDKIFVILDDIVGSGDSMVSQKFSYRNFANDCLERGLDINLVFAPLITLSDGANNIDYNIEEQERTDEDIVLTNNIVDFGGFVQNLSEKESAILRKLIGNYGYSTGGACTAVPYMVPDNSSEASGLLLRKALNNGSSPRANKSLSFNDNKERIKDFDKRFKEKMRQY